MTSCDLKLVLNTAAAAAMIIGLAASADAQIYQFGPGTGLAGPLSSDTPGGDRLNVDRTVAFNLFPGTYSIHDFTLNVANANTGIGNAGTITPMLLTGTPGNYTTLWMGSAFDPTTTGVQTPITYAPGAETFTVPSITKVYAGFFTSNQGSAIPGLRSGAGFGPTDHDSAFIAPTGIGQAVNGFSNPNLNFTYAFAVNANIPTASIAPNVTVTNGNSAAVSNDLLQTHFGSVTSSGIGPGAPLDLGPLALEPNLRDGIATDTTGYTTGNNSATGAANGAVLTYTLDTIANPLGYQIDQIDLFHGWRDDGRDEIISFDVAYATVDDPNTFLDLVVGGASGDYAANYGRISITPGGDNDFLATSVSALRFTFNNLQNNAGGISEIDVLGSAIVPEPASIAIWSLIGVGLVGFAVVRQRRSA